VDTDGLDDALVLSPVPLRTMGRGYPEERAYFLAAAGAGRYAALRVPVPEAGTQTQAEIDAEVRADAAAQTDPTAGA
jgi:hypothetical protein